MEPGDVTSQFHNLNKTADNILHSLKALHRIPFEFEKSLNLEDSQKWFEDNWQISIIFASIYLFVIFGGKYYMKKRERLELRGFLALWNFSLAAFSILGTARVLPEVLEVLNQKNGFYHSVCTSGYENNKVLLFWAGAFAFSKIAELGDTIFIILRKQELIFLHWSHHAVVLVYCFYGFSSFEAQSRYFIAMNFFAHSCMYMYYGFRALQFCIPKPIAIAITSLQIFQMVMALTVILFGLYFNYTGVPCRAKNSIMFIGLVIYTTYFLLFAQFFTKAYLSKQNSKKKLVRQYKRGVLEKKGN